jgi:phosphatidylglycerophosphatase A
MSTLPLRRFLLAAVTLGALVPIVLLIISYVRHSLFDNLELMLWPSSIMLLATDGHEHLDIYSVEVIALSIATNMMLYFIAGFIVWQIYRAVQRGVLYFTNKP